jgi:hypothetical protein
MPQRMHARPSAWAKVSSRLMAEWQAIFTIWLRTLAACTALTVQSAYDAPGHLIADRVHDRLLEMILVVMLTLVSELPCLSDARSRPGLADDSGCPEFVSLLAAY